MQYLVAYSEGSADVPSVLKPFTANVQQLLDDGWQLAGDLHLTVEHSTCYAYQVLTKDVPAAAEPVPETAKPRRRGSHAVPTE